MAILGSADPWKLPTHHRKPAITRRPPATWPGRRIMPTSPDTTSAQPTARSASGMYSGCDQPSTTASATSDHTRAMTATPMAFGIVTESSGAPDDAIDGGGGELGLGDEPESARLGKASPVVGSGTDRDQHHRGLRS